MLFPVTLVGSLPQPDWLIDRTALAKDVPPRVRVARLWRVPEPFLAEAQDDATRLAIRAQEDAGLDIVTDGEIRRESYSNRFATALEGIDPERPGEGISRSGRKQAVPRVVAKLRRARPVEVEDLKFLRRHTTRMTKITVPGPFTMSRLSQDDFYGDIVAMAMDYAAAVNEEVKDLFAAGADVVQIDEPYLQAQPDEARRYGLAALDRALEGVEGATAVHLCFGYAIYQKSKPSGYSFLPELAACRCAQVSVETAQPALDCSQLAPLAGKKILVGCIDLSTPEVEAPEAVVARIERALKYVRAENVILAPDCGMKFLPRESAAGKMRAMVQAAKILRARHG